MQVDDAEMFSIFCRKIKFEEEGYVNALDGKKNPYSSGIGPHCEPGTQIRLFFF